jgi:hypothetical protein
MDVITEPATLVTDYLLAAFTAMLAWRLTSTGGAAQRWWALGFAATSVSGIAGGTVHGFRNVLHPLATAALWLLTLEGLFVAAIAIVLATLAKTAVSPRRRDVVTIVVCVAYGLYGSWVAMHPRFGLAIAGYGGALLVLTVVHVQRWLATRATESAFMLAGVAVSAVAAAVQLAGLAPHRLFNHNDLFHVIQAGAVWLLYRGASLSEFVNHKSRITNHQ